MQGHHVVLIEDTDEARRIFEEIGVTEGGSGYMIPKAIFKCVRLKNIPARSGNLIKQEMLAKGGEAAVAKNTITGEGSTDIILMGTIKQYRLLIKKLKLQPFGLKELAEEIELIIQSHSRQKFNMKLANGKELELGKRTLIMGILNVTPDSFSDGGRYNEVDNAVRHALQMCEDGADIIDVGGASSRPDSVMADEEEELRRVMPVVERLSKEGICISVDTFRGEVARQVLDTGAHIINDIGGLQLDSGLLDVLVKWQVPVILMHNRMQIKKDQVYSDLISDVILELKQSINMAVEGGLQSDKIIIDPGVGFGKTVAENRILIKRLEEFASLGKPVLLGTSRKSFIGHTLNLEVDERLEGSLATVSMGIMNGADIIRVHDVKESKRVALMTDAVMRENG